MTLVKQLNVTPTSGPKDAVPCQWTICRVSIEHYENFPVASVLCPPAIRPPIAAIYRFARTADDLADEGAASAHDRLQALHRYRECLSGVARGQAAEHWPQVFGPLGAMIERHRLPLPLLHDLLDAFEQDCGNPVYRDRHQLLDYCRRSANPIGRLLLHLNGVDDGPALAQSDAICTALQLINFWQDPSVDLPRGRSYFPAEDLVRHGVTAEHLRSGRDTSETQALLTELCAWAGKLMRQGSPLAFRLRGRMGWELRMVIQGGLRILERIAAMDHRTLGARPTLRARDLPVMLWRAAWMNRAWPMTETRP
jgi:squalene synthase HpnC